MNGDEIDADEGFDDDHNYGDAILTIVGGTVPPAAARRPGAGDVQPCAWTDDPPTAPTPCPKCVKYGCYWCEHFDCHPPVAPIHAPASGA